MMWGNLFFAVLNAVLAVIVYRRGWKVNALVCGVVAVYCFIAAAGVFLNKW